jgi:hypothetical protein
MLFTYTNFLYIFTVPVIYCNYNISKYTKFINFMYLFGIVFNYKPILLNCVDNYAKLMYYYHHYYPIGRRYIKENLYKIGYYNNKYFKLPQSQILS